MVDKDKKVISLDHNKKQQTSEAGLFPANQKQEIRIQYLSKTKALAKA